MKYQARIQLISSQITNTDWINIEDYKYLPAGIEIKMSPEDAMRKQAISYITFVPYVGMKYCEFIRIE